MALTDDQLEVLEAYLDGELTTGEEDALRQRLSAEAELASALAALRGEREVRVAIWKSCEPDAASVARLIAHVEQAIDRHNAWAYRLSRMRIPFAAAACILIGFSVGWLGRGPASGTPPLGGNEVVVDARPPAGVPNGMPPVATVGASKGPVELPIVDEYGRVVATQRFESADEAQKFIEDLNNWHKREEQIKNGGNIVPASSEKF